tara:strand:+ start:8652 stop:9278 length:627 start_codon:yes stop_codon:yes gene_type:complete
MPYYPQPNLLFIHIPKTGGTSVENFMGLQYKQTVFGKPSKTIDKKDQMMFGKLCNISLHHQVYRTLYKYKELLNIPFDNKMKIITIVRNPYDRIISDLYWLKFLKRDSKYTQAQIYSIIKTKYLKHAHDNHSTPQYLFLIDDEEKIPSNITIMRCENLTNDMTKYGFDEYCGKDTSQSYKHMLNSDSISFINNKYKKDFELFNYDMIN